MTFIMTGRPELRQRESIKIAISQSINPMWLLREASMIYEARTGSSRATSCSGAQANLSGSPPRSLARRLAIFSLSICLAAGLTVGAAPITTQAAQAATAAAPTSTATAPSPQAGANSPGLDSDVAVALIGFLAGSVAALLGVFSKYLLDYQLEKRKLELQERQNIAVVIGPSQSNLIRATRDLFRWLSSFFDHPDLSRQGLIKGLDPARDAPSLHEWARLLFNLIAWGRITQDAINALPAAVIKERADLQQAYVFVDLIVDLLAYGGLFKAIELYEPDSQTMRLFSDHVEALAEAGFRLRQANAGAITRTAVDELYQAPRSALLPLREFVLILNGESALAAGVIVARLAAVRAVAAGFLQGYPWTIQLPAQREILAELQAHLAYASRSSGANLPFGKRVPRNLDALIERYRCGFLNLPLE